MRQGGRCGCLPHEQRNSVCVLCVCACVCVCVLCVCVPCVVRVCVLVSYQQMASTRTRNPPQKGGRGSGSEAGISLNLSAVSSTRCCSVARSGMAEDWGLDHAPMLRNQQIQQTVHQHTGWMVGPHFFVQHTLPTAVGSACMMERRQRGQAEHRGAAKRTVHRGVACQSTRRTLRLTPCRGRHVDTSDESQQPTLWRPPTPC